MKPAAALTAFALVMAVSGCATGTTQVSVVGTVDDTVRTVAMPSLSIPAVDLDAGFTTATSASTDATSTTATTYQFGTTQAVATVTVAEGSSVRAGQVLAVLDTAALRAQLAAARADSAVTSAHVDVLAAAIDDTYDKGHDVATAKKKLKATIRTLASTLESLKKAKPKLKAARTDLTEKCASAEDLLSNYPPVVVPGIPTKEELRAAIATLKAGIAKIDAKLAQITATEPKLRAGLTKARAAVATLDSAAAKISDARSQLRQLHDLAQIAADTADVPVALAQVQLTRATLTAPVSGVVTTIAQVGERLAPGAAVVTIRPSGVSTVTAWLSPSQLAQVCLKDSAQISGDWMAAGDSIGAKLTRISPTSQFPPSSTTTDETHLTRAVQVEFTATSGLPAGVPVTISLTGCRSATGQSEQDR